MKCCICRDDIDVHPISGWDKGHNAEPIMSGRCCTYCNETLVTPTRIRRLNPRYSQATNEKDK